jgi:hypothetical protein
MRPNPSGGHQVTRSAESSARFIGALDAWLESYRELATIQSGKDLTDLFWPAVCTFFKYASLLRFDLTGF